MIRSLMLAALLALSSISYAADTAQPPCLSKQWGSTGSEEKSGSINDLEWVAWTCLVKGVAVPYFYAWRSGYVIKRPDVAGMTPNQMFRAYWAANVGTLTNEEEAKVREYVAEAFR